MKPGKKSKNPTNAYINKNFVIRVKENNNQKTKLCSANSVAKLIANNELTAKIFTKIIAKGEDKTTVHIRNRLKIDFVSK